VPVSGTSAECVINVSEGRDRSVIATLAAAGGDHLLDLHSDAEHHRSVLTLGGPLETLEGAARAVAVAAVEALDLTPHVGVHPRLGVLDVVPFVPLTSIAPEGEAWWRAVAARDRFAVWAGSTLDLPCFLFGSERTLPDIRHNAFGSLAPDTGPPTPHPTAGASAVGVRLPLVAYNVWIAGTGGDDPSAVLSVARALATELRSPSVRSLGLPLTSGAQVSCNLIDPSTTSIADLYDTVAVGARAQGCSVVRAELVGLVPEVVLRAVTRQRWQELDLREDRTIEFRMAEQRFPTGVD
jgi:glutamate formiminotransferase